MNRKTNLYVLAAMLFVALLAMPAVSAAEDEAGQADDNENTVDAAKNTAYGYMAIGAGLAIGLAGIGTGIAQSHTGAAAVGAVAEDRSNFANSLIFIAIPETVVILGFVIANQIMGLIDISGN
uniref:F0F1-type ATP synthase, subunit c/Archaeal/vacuolar-type H+-ATPase, subunit K n=1 Tax=uncultured marine group II/III euryarchaeote SAT1000_07_H11 TaxID=1456556 RepID=A0A075I887_9EURY|nr:F0F1-type ATP synthase, subunit c/Archaeal/vacuolar-type H+-ATPase, subunit K [uncultured marine group II/III euryarchaeote SAT1000_07_H11]